MRGFLNEVEDDSVGEIWWCWYALYEVVLCEFLGLHVGSIDEKAAGFPFENASWDSCDKSCILSGLDL